ncbi:MAG: helix-turn-helix domain-containing protein [Pseudomonadota bacterium]|nr:helix-turn-helix domain-containing protein [Pseudomonadota bacterium]
MIVTGRQIRAARGLMGWSMEDLADKAGVTTVTIRHIESESVTPQEKTLSSILSVFDKQGVEFHEDEGVKLRRQYARYYSGKSGYRQLLDHIYETLKGGGRLRQFNFGDLRYLAYADEFMSDHLKRMSTISGLDAKVLEGEGDTEVPVSYCSYRRLDAAFERMAPWYLYGDHLVLSLFERGNRKEFAAVHSKMLAEKYAAQFDIFWAMAERKKPRGK